MTDDASNAENDASNGGGSLSVTFGLTAIVEATL